MKILPVVLVAALAACQSWPSRSGKPPPPVRGAGTGAGSSGGGAATASGAGEKAGEGSWYGMCALQRQIMEAPTPEQQQALAEKAMPGMSPEARQRHLQMMAQNCR